MALTGAAQGTDGDPGAAGEAAAPEASGPREILVRVRADHGGCVRATRGQTAIWRCISWQSGDPAYFNFIRILPLPDGVAEHALADALARLAQRHEALRTGFHVDGDGTLVQTVRTAIDLRVAVHPADEGKGGQLAGDVAEQLKRIPFRSGGPDEPGEPPVRCALVPEPPPGPALLVFVFDHLALDGASAQVLQAELLGLLTDPAAGPAAPAGRPLELAAFEGGCRARGSVRRRWRTGGAASRACRSACSTIRATRR